MHKILPIGQSLISILGVAAFFVGYFTNITWLLIIGGTALVLNDIISIIMKTLNPILPCLFAVGLALIIVPWYLGVFWASAAFATIDLPKTIDKLRISLKQPSCSKEH